MSLEIYVKCSGLVFGSLEEAYLALKNVRNFSPLIDAKREFLTTAVQKYNPLNG